ncbi:MAG: class IV adenylate cyclase [Clostridia bacterium]|nr:class IV adenylate cyclase [Clostridia bacterium]
MYEYEIKFKIENLKKFSEICDNLKIKFSNEQVQVDNVWILNDADGTNLITGMPVVRTRIENKIATITLKKEIKHGTFEEYETNVSDITQANEIIKNLGMRRLVEIKKKRRTAIFKNYNLCLDNVEKLGNFIEIEFLAKNFDENSKEKILELAKQFFLSENDIVVNTYNTLLCRKYNLK